MLRKIATLLLIATALFGSIGLAAAQDADDQATPADAYGGELEKDVLAEDQNLDSAPGETLSLTRYIIPAGAKLPVHMHPGIQIGSVQSGTLTYTVVDGELPITRADGTLEIVTSGTTVEFSEGDTWIEPEGMVHFAENRTDADVVLIATALLETDEDATILVDISATPDATPAP